MQNSTRPLTKDEKSLLHKRYRIFAFRNRPLACKDEAEGIAHRHVLVVCRVWNLISCEGPPCCPNSWLIETADDEFVYIESWDFLDAVDTRFPGRRLTIDVTPLTGLILSAKTSGDAVETIEFESDDMLIEVSIAVADCSEFGVISAEKLPQGMRAGQR